MRVKKKLEQIIHSAEKIEILLEDVDDYLMDLKSLSWQLVDKLSEKSGIKPLK